MTDIIVFLGPSLTLAEATQILPNARYLPPVRCGDIVRVLRLKPKLIGIIDGYFEDTPAVWHKEILYALEKGVAVIGGSSMGALRASELTHFGMQVVGNIAADYASGTLNDDDEVAVLHSTEASGYSPLTDAMVNIRATLQYAITEKIISAASAAEIITAAKQLFYQQRSLNQAIDIASNNSNIQQMQKLKTWLQNVGYVNAKKQDAILVLTTLANYKNNPIITPNFQANKPTFFRSLQKNILCRPFTHYYDWLPIQEKTALAARYLGSNYRLTRRLAHLLAACYEMTYAQTAVENTDLSGLELAIIDDDGGWNGRNDCSASDKTALQARLEKIRKLIAQEKKLADAPDEYLNYILILLRLASEYTAYKKAGKFTSTTDSKVIINLLKQQDPLRYHVMHCFAECWWLVERRAAHMGLTPSQKVLQEYSDNFRLTHKLFTPELTEQWLTNNDLDWEGYQTIITANARLSILIIQNNSDPLCNNFNNNSEDNWWLLDALRLTGTYTAAKDLLTNPTKLKQLQLKAKQENNDLEQYAIPLDFIGGENDFMAAFPCLNDNHNYDVENTVS